MITSLLRRKQDRCLWDGSEGRMNDVLCCYIEGAWTMGFCILVSPYENNVVGGSLSCGISNSGAALGQCIVRWKAKLLLNPY